MISIGPTGNIIKGDIFDVNKSALEAALRDYDTQLYIKWNATKYNGYGCWELRRRPSEKTIVDYAEYGKDLYFKIDYYEDAINHVKDFPFLNYRILEWVQQSDLWRKLGFDPNRPDRVSKFVLDIEAAEKKHKADKREKLRAELRYNTMQDRSVIRDFRERINSGVNPALLSAFWGKQPK